MKNQEYIDIHVKEKDARAQVFRRLKKKKPRNLDDVFHDAHEQAFAKIDCLDCANCCKTTSPIFRDVDIQRIAKLLRVTPESFEKEYLRKDEENDWVLKSSPCTFLGPDNKCFIYDVRPMACREYPHTDRKRMIQIMDLTLKNAEICPAVSQIVGEVVRQFP